MTHTRFWSAAVVALLCIAWPAIAEEPAGRLKLTTRKVIIFKDGYSLIIKRAVATTDKQGRVFTDEVPDAAVLGSFWATPKEGTLLESRAGWIKTKRSYVKQAPCTSAIELLLANQGKVCRVTLNDKDVHTGTIHRVLTTRTSRPLPDALRERLGLPEAPRGISRTISGVNGSRFVLRTPDGDLMLPVSQIKTLRIKQMATRWDRTITETGRTKRLTYRFAKPGQPRELLLIYFRPGLRWIPTYRLALDAGKKQLTAGISLQAVLLNEAEDLVDTLVDLVVGVPNFRFKSLPSPLILEARLRNTLAQAAPQLMRNRGQQLASNTFSQRASEWRRPTPRRPPSGGGTIELPAELTADGKQDLFIYHLSKLSLKKGQRIALPIFSATVPYRDIYTWDVQFKQPAYRGRGRSRSSSPLRLSKNQTWHQLLLTNTTRMPWTTGAAFLMLGTQPLAQELMTYTSPKDQVRVPVTVSIDLRGSYRETETGRQLEALKYQGYRYTKISKQGKLHLRNHKSVPVEVEISCRFGGKADTVSHDGKATLGAFDRNDWVSYHGHEGVNNHTDVRWRVKLEPGEAIELTVDYHFYVRY